MRTWSLYGTYLLAATLVACTGETASTSQSLADDTAGISSLYATIQHNAASFDLQRFRRLSPAQLYRSSLSKSASAKGNIYGLPASSLHAFLVRNEETSLAYLGHFNSYGDKLDTQHATVNPSAITREDVRDFVATLRNSVAGTGTALADAAEFALNPWDDSYTGLGCHEAFQKDQTCAKIASGQCTAGDPNKCGDGEAADGFNFNISVAVAACQSAFARVVQDPNRHCDIYGNYHGTDPAAAGGAAANGAGSGANQENNCQDNATCINNSGNDNVFQPHP